MRILLTGTTGYIAKRLALKLLEQGHELVCCVRDLDRIPDEIETLDGVSFIKVDFLDIEAGDQFPKDIDAAYYLIHSMSYSSKDFEAMEARCALNFNLLLAATTCKQVIYLSGMVNQQSLSKHLSSRFQVERILSDSSHSLTTLRAGIIVGSGSASFEIIRDLVEKLPVMIAPKWLKTPSQPIAIRDVLAFLTGVLGREQTYGRSYDIGGPQVLTYKEMLLQFAQVRGLKRKIWTIPILSPKLSSYWLYFVTSTSFSLARSLVASMKVPVIAQANNLAQELGINPIPYNEAVSLAFQKIQQHAVLSSWKDAMSSGVEVGQLASHVKVPYYGCFKDVRSRAVKDQELTLDRIWAIGGQRGWYSFNWLWKLRGAFDKLMGGVGLRRGRTHDTYLEPGDPLDFWRVILADKAQKRLLLFAEMKLPGEAWLEFRLIKDRIYQRAVFRPKGVWGRLYWYSVSPFHAFVFSGMINALANPNKQTYDL